MEKQKALQWFVDFANLNLETISPGDRAKLLVESGEYLFPQEEVSEWNNSVLPLSRREREGVAWAFKIPDKESNEYWSIILHLHKVVLAQFLELIVSAPHIKKDGYETMAVRIVWGNKTPFSLSFFPITENQEEYVRFKIFRLLEGFPGHAIRKCPGCQRFLFNPTRREKAFCSPQCMWRVIAGKRRKELKEKHPKKYKAYLKKQSEIMRQRYENSQHAKGYKKVSHYKRKSE